MMPTTRIPAAIARRVPLGDLVMDMVVGLATGGGIWLPDPAPCATCRHLTQIVKHGSGWPLSFICLSCASKEAGPR